MVDFIAATVAAVDILEAARLAVVAEQGIGVVSTVLWRAQAALNADARRALTGADR